MEFDVVVVGSGFGGAVTCFGRGRRDGRPRARARRRLPPDSFPRTPHGFAGNFWDPARRRFGLFDVRSFSHIDTIVAGLGGGSLIYANVLIRRRDWFDTDVDSADSVHGP